MTHRPLTLVLGPPSADATLGAALPDADALFGPADANGWLGTLGRYRVRRKLDHGGMAAVYLGRDDVLGRWVALKVLLPQAGTASARERFFREARATAAVRHPSVVGVYETGEDRGLAYIAMEFLQGIDLARYLTRGRPTLAQAVRIAAGAARGLGAAHAMGYVHRDVKPANLWLEAPGGRVRLLDFGVSRLVADTRPGLTADGVVVGTPDYMSPEQALGKPVDHRSDLFSLGSVLYELTTGRRPFTGAAAVTILSGLVLDDPPPVRGLNPDAPPALEELIRRLMAKRPGDRPASAAAVAADLRSIGRSLASRRQPPRPAASCVAPGGGRRGPGRRAVPGRTRPGPRAGWLLAGSLVALAVATAFLVAVVQACRHG